MKSSSLLLVQCVVLTTSALSMGGVKARRGANVPGNLFVDESCIDCDTCRWMAPKTYGRAGAKSFVHRQPDKGMDDDEREAAFAAVVACPTGSIRMESPDPAMKTAVASFPLPIHSSIPRVFHLGFHCAASFGATPYLVCNPDGLNVMIDAPRFTTRLAKQLEALGGIHKLLLTHMDDVGDMNRWKERFPALQRYMHVSDVRDATRWPYIDMTGVETQFDGDGPWEVVSGLTAIHTPGHSRGSVSYLADAALCGGGEGVLFTGDHFCFSGRLGRLDGMARFGWDLEAQSKSIKKLADLPFTWVLPGHGRRHRFESSDERADGMRAAAADFADDPMGDNAPGPVFVQPGGDS